MGLYLDVTVQKNFNLISALRYNRDVEMFDLVPGQTMRLVCANEDLWSRLRKHFLRHQTLIASGAWE